MLSFFSLLPTSTFLRFIHFIYFISVSWFYVFFFYSFYSYISVQLQFTSTIDFCIFLVFILFWKKFIRHSLNSIQQNIIWITFLKYLQFYYHFYIPSILWYNRVLNFISWSVDTKLFLYIMHYFKRKIVLVLGIYKYII